MRKIIDESPRPIRDINPEIPEWLEAIIAKLMSREKIDRFEHANEVHQLLEQCLGHVQQPETVPLPNKVCPPSVARRRGFNKVTLASLVIACLAVVGFLASKGLWSDKSNRFADDNNRLGDPSSNDTQNIENQESEKQEGQDVQGNRKTLADLPQSEIVWILEELLGENMGIPRNSVKPTPSLVESMEQLLDRVPSSRQALAQKAVELGKPEVAKILLAGARVDAAAGEAIQLAEMLMTSGDEEKALDAYLDAFRREPILFRREQITSVFAKHNRLEDLANVFTEERLSETRGITILLDLLEALMKDDLAATAGIPFLERLWMGRPDVRPFLSNTTFWESRSGIQMKLLRARWIPGNIEEEGDGWEHLCRVGLDGGWQNWLEPVILNETTIARVN